MTETPARPATPTPEALPAERPATPPAALTPAETAGPDRGALVGRLLAYPGDWRKVAVLLLDTRGPEAFTDTALQAMTAIADALEYHPETDPC